MHLLDPTEKVLGDRGCAGVIHHQARLVEPIHLEHRSVEGRADELFEVAGRW
jgi:hypothetical protein